MNKLIMSRRATFSIKKKILDALYLGDSSSATEKIIQASIHTGVQSAKGKQITTVPAVPMLPINGNAYFHRYKIAKYDQRVKQK